MLCVTHLLKRLLAFREAFKLLATKIMYASSEADARKAFEDLQEAMNKDCSRAVSCLQKDLNSLLAHYKFDQKFWRSLKTTNGIERVNKELKRRTKSMETIGEQSLQAVVAFTALKLELGWQIHKVDSKSLDVLYGEGRRKNILERTVEEIGLLN
jgi:putative transposase